MITIEWQTRTYTETEADPEDRWDRGNTRTEVFGFKAIWSEGDIPDAQFERWGNDNRADGFQPGETVFAAVVQYSTGDTFGHDAGSQIEVLGVYPTFDLAQGMVAEAEKYGYNFGQKINAYEGVYLGKKFHVGWNGYFESLDRAWVEQMTVSYV